MRHAFRPLLHLHQIPAYLTLMISGMALILSIVSFFSLRGPVPTLITALDFTVAVLLLLLGLWIYRQPQDLRPRMLVVGVVAIASTMALTVIPEIAFIPLTTLPILIALIMFERIEVLLLQPFYILLVFVITPVSGESFSFAMLFFQFLVFLSIWLSQSRTQHQERIAAHERTQRAVAEFTREQADQQRLLIGFFQHELRNTADGMAGLIPLVRMGVEELAPASPPRQT
ncbi:MAG TPA: hypothetical protein VGE07_31550, partial [Herpetosiphonaceae bacterium]